MTDRRKELRPLTNRVGNFLQLVGGQVRAKRSEVRDILCVAF